MKTIYLIGKYRADTIAEIDSNINAAREVAKAFWREGFKVISPHMNSAHFDGCAPDEAFLELGRELISDMANAVVVLPDSGDSRGTNAEEAHAYRSGIPVYHLDARSVRNIAAEIGCGD